MGGKCYQRYYLSYLSEMAVFARLLGISLGKQMLLKKLHFPCTLLTSSKRASWLPKPEQGGVLTSETTLWR